MELIAEESRLALRDLDKRKELFVETQHLQKSRLICFRCGSTNHLQWDCRQRRRDSRSYNRRVPSVSSVSDASESSSERAQSSVKKDRNRRGKGKEPPSNSNSVKQKENKSGIKTRNRLLCVLKKLTEMDWHVFVGSEVGLLKGVDVEKNSFSNLNFDNTLSKDDEITAMCWEDSSEKKIYYGQKNQMVKVYDCESRSFSSFQNSNIGDGAIKGLYCYNGHILTAVESGIVKLWNEDAEKEFEINTGGNLCRMVANPFRSHQIATGGEENDLKIWDLQNRSEPIFKAKNVKNDFLDLRVPVWITDMKFNSNDKIVTCTRHHQIRLYDPKAQKRPVIDMEFERYPLMSLSLAHNENQVIVGTSRGRMGLIDLRKKLLVHVFKGFAGSIRCVQCHPSLPLVASCGLDRFLRIHDLNKHKLVKKIYLKTRLNCLLMRHSVSDVSKPEAPKPIENKAAVELDEEEENIWESMAVVSDKIRKKKLSGVPTNKNKRQKIEVSS